MQNDLMKPTFRQFRMDNHLTSLSRSCGRHSLHRPDYDADPLVLDLLSRFLELDWEKRITASDALDHEFFAEDDSSS